MFNRDPEIGLSKSKNEGLNYFLYLLVFKGAPEIVFLEEETLELGVTKISWGVSLMKRDYASGVHEYALIESYFESESGAHVSTHVAKKIINSDNVQQLLIDVASLLASRQDGSYNEDDLTFVERPLKAPPVSE